MATPPAGRQPRRSPDRQDPSRPSGAFPDDADDARLAPSEQARIDQAVVTVRSGRGTGPILVATLVIAAFLLGLVRPWDWLAGGATTAARPGDGLAGATSGPGDSGGAGPGVNAGPPAAAGAGDGAPTDASFAAPTCGYPTGWRTAVISLWAGRRARVWTAAEAVSASGPDDPSIPFEPLASDTVEALGWCAPVSGPERPPLTALGTLFRIHDGVATEVAVDRVEPASRDALGELWAPKAETAGHQKRWAPGHYVVRLATASGTYARYLGLDVGVTQPTAQPSVPATPELSGSPTPASSGS